MKKIINYSPIVQVDDFKSFLNAYASDMITCGDAINITYDKASVALGLAGITFLAAGMLTMYVVDQNKRIKKLENRLDDLELDKEIGDEIDID